MTGLSWAQYFQSVIKETDTNTGLPRLPEGYRWKITSSGGAHYPLRVKLQCKGWFFWATEGNGISRENAADIKATAWDVAERVAGRYRQHEAQQMGHAYTGTYPPKNLDEVEKEILDQRLEQAYQALQGLEEL